MTTLEFLRWARDTSLPNGYPYLRAILIEGNGPPVDGTPMDCLAYADTDTGKCFVCKAKDGAWEELVSAADLGLQPGESVLTADQ